MPIFFSSFTSLIRTLHHHPSQLAPTLDANFSVKGAGYLTAIMPSARASSSTSAANGKLSKLESALYRAAQSSRGGVITQDAIEFQFKHESLEDRLGAINGLLKKSLFTAQTLNGSVQFAATRKRRLA